MSAAWWCFLGCCIAIIPGVSAFSHSALLRVAHRRTSRLPLSSSPLLPLVLSPRAGRAVLRPQNRRGVEMTMKNGQRLSQGGDDENDKAARHTVFEDNAQRVEVPSEVSQRELKFYLLSETLQHAIEAENYSKAAKIKRKIKSLRSQLMKKLEHKVQGQVEKMRTAHETKMTKSKLARAQHDLTCALADEDYSSAARHKLIIEQEESRWRRGNGWLPRAITTCLDRLWLASSVSSISKSTRPEKRLGLLASLSREDKLVELETALRAAVEREDFTTAAAVRDELRLLLMHRDLKKMQEQLVAQLRASKAELTKKNKGMSQDEGRSLEEALLAAVTLEDYQAAAEVWGRMERKQAEREQKQLEDLVAMLCKQIQEQRQREEEEERSWRAEEAPPRVRIEERSHALELPQSTLTSPQSEEEEEEEAREEEDYRRAASVWAEMAEMEAGDRVASLERLMQKAERSQDWRQAARVKQELVGIYTRTLSAPILAALGFYAAQKQKRGGSVAGGELRAGGEEEAPAPTAAPIAACPPPGDEPASAARAAGTAGSGGSGERKSRLRMRKEAGVGEESQEPGGGEERESGAEVLSVGQIVEHRRLGYRAVVVGSTKVCAAAARWVWHHKRILSNLAHGREQIFYHIIADTRDVSLSPPDVNGGMRIGDRSAQCEMWVGDCSPAFLCGTCPDDQHPLMLTGYVAADELEIVDGSKIGRDSHSAAKIWPDSHSAAPSLTTTTSSAFSPSSMIHLVCSFFKLLKAALRPSWWWRRSLPLNHPALPLLFDGYREGTSRLNPRPLAYELAFFHMPEWL